MVEWKKVKLREVLKQHNEKINLDDHKEYKQITVSNTGKIKFRGIKKGSQIGTKKQTIAHKGWFIYSRLGVHEGSFGIVPEDLDGAIVTSDMPMFEINKNKILPDFLIYSLNLPHFHTQFIDLTRGLAQSRIREKFILDLEINLPSLEAQENIIKRLNNFNNKNKEFSIMQDNNLGYISNLRQQILQEAVQGKLVSQNPKDEPASELLKKIKAEKEKLIKEGKIKKQKPLPPISEEEISYELPKGWVWCRLGEIGNPVESSIVDGPFGSSIDVKKDYIQNGIPVIRMLNIKPYRLILNNLKFISFKKYETLKRHNILQKDVLFSKVGAGIGESCVVPYNFNEGLLSTTGIARFRVGKIVIPEYLCNFLIFSKEMFIQLSSTTAQPFLNMGTIKKVLFPLPPLPEQKRIVEKVNKLMSYCDELEKKIKENQVNSEKLMGAVLMESFSR